MAERFDRGELVRRGAGAALVIGAGGWAAGTALSARHPNLTALARQLDGDLVARGASGYSDARLLWNPRYDTIRPIGIAYVESIDDIRRVIRWSARNDVRLAIRSGGHSFAGYSTTKGLVADLSRLSKVRPNADDMVSVGAGARLGSVYERLWATKRAVPFGTCPQVGVSGLTLGGGHGYSSRALGLACDNVSQIEIVTADGRLRVCNEHSEPDLFWALRGGGAGSFGVVTKLVFRTHPVDSVTTVNIQWAWKDAKKVAQSWQSFVPSSPDTLTCSLSFTPPAKAGGTPQVALNGQVFGTRDQALSLLAPLTDAEAPAKVSAVYRPFIGAVNYFAAENPERRAYAAKSNYAPVPISDAGLDVIIGAAEAAASDPQLAATGILLFAHSGAVGRVDRDAMAFVHRDALFAIRYTAFWSVGAPADTGAANLAWVRGTYAAMQPYLSRGAVTNYVDPDLKNWGTAYYGSHLKRLVAVKRHYDPNNFFRFPQSIPTRL